MKVANKILIGFISLLLSGISVKAEAISNPWFDCSGNLGYCTDIAGFYFPLNVKDYSARAMEGMMEISFPLDKNKKVTVRKVLYSDSVPVSEFGVLDISGDYNQYPVNKDLWFNDEIPYRIRGYKDDIRVVSFKTTEGHYSCMGKGLTPSDIKFIYKLISDADTPIKSSDEQDDYSLTQLVQLNRVGNKINYVFSDASIPNYLLKKGISPMCFNRMNFGNKNFCTVSQVKMIEDYYKQKEYDEKTKSFNKSIYFDGARYDIKTRAEETEKLLAEKKYKQAFDIADKLSKEAPCYHKPYEIKALASMHLKKYDEALENIKLALENNDLPYNHVLYGYKLNILFNAAYNKDGKPKSEYTDEFYKDFKEVSSYIASDIDNSYSELEQLIEYIINFIVNSDTGAEYKINTILSMMKADGINDLRYDNTLYYKLCAVALRIAMATSEKEYEKEETKKGEVIYNIDNFAGEEPFYIDITNYLHYTFDGDDKRAKAKLKEIDGKIYVSKSYKKMYLPLDSIDSVVTYVKKIEPDILKYAK